jgi:hypothetical protein
MHVHLFYFDIISTRNRYECIILNLLILLSKQIHEHIIVILGRKIKADSRTYRIKQA